MFNHLYEYFFPGQTDLKEAMPLALEVEEQVRHLSGLPAHTAETSDVTTVLRSTRLLLERLVQQQTRSAELEERSPQEEQIVAKVLSEPPKHVPETPPEPLAQDIVIKASEPSQTALELIKLRDYVLMANPDELAVAHRILESLYRKLGQMLEKEGLTPLEMTGAFNYEQQQVVETQGTNDPSLDEIVSSTVRPGYLFNQKLVRPQEVIVYTYSVDASN